MEENDKGENKSDNKYQKLMDIEKKVDEMWNNGEISKFVNTGEGAVDIEISNNVDAFIIDRLKDIPAKIYNTTNGTWESKNFNNLSKNFNNKYQKLMDIEKKVDEIEQDKYTQISNELDSMERTLNSSEGFEEYQIAKLKEKIKEFESKLKEKEKPKTITISNNVHNLIKKHCFIFNLKIGEWVEKVLLEKMEELSAVKIEPDISDEERKKLLRDKYKSKPKFLVKSDKLIAFVKTFKFIGHHPIDSKPIYEYIGDNYEMDLEKIGCNIEQLPIGNVLTTKTYKKEYTNFELDMGKVVDTVKEEKDISKLKFYSEKVRKASEEYMEFCRVSMKEGFIIDKNFLEKSIDLKSKLDEAKKEYDNCVNS